MLNTLRNNLIAVSAALLLAPVASVQATSLEGIPSGAYDLDLSHASVVWKVSHFGFSTYVGRFNDFDADLDLDSENFANSSAKVVIQVNSLETGYPFPEKEDFNKKLSTDWFNSGEHPTITFVSNKVSDLTENGDFTIEGDLTLMGQTHPVTLAATLNGSTPNHPFMKVPLVGFSATTSIDRTTWGLSKYAPNIGAEVMIEIQGEFLKAKGE